VSGERCGYRPQCPEDGHRSCRYYLDRHDLCAITVADLGPHPAHTVGELFGVTRQTVLIGQKRTLRKCGGRLRFIHAAGFEHPHSRVPPSAPWWHKEDVKGAA
jgi:hypothetical protein